MNAGRDRHEPFVFHACAPGPPLSEFVEALWLHEGGDAPHAKERVLPDGAVGIVVNLREDAIRVYGGEQADREARFAGAVVSGARSESFAIDTPRRASLVGVQFTPGGASPFLGVPADEVQNLHVSLDALWGPAASTLRERLLQAQGPAARFRVLEEALLAQARGRLQRHPAVGYALRALSRVPHAETVAAVRSRIGLSHRRFIHVFREQVGLAPKTYARVRRFQQVLSEVRQGRKVAWAEVATACGYADQAHLIHDFRAFSGLTPTAYAARVGEFQNHVPLP